MRVGRSFVFLSTLIWLVAGQSARPQSTEQAPELRNTIRVETTLVTVPVIVTDQAGRFVSGLAGSDFQLFENGRPQEIASFSSTEEPFNVALLIDSSRSTKELMGAIRKATRSFINQLHPRDRVLIVTFSEQVNFHGDFTNDRGRLRRAIDQAQGGDLTSLYDAISRTMNEKLAPLKGRKAIVVFSDGMDTCSQDATYDSSLELVARAGVPIYSVQYNTADMGVGVGAPRPQKRSYSSNTPLPDQERSHRAEWERYRIATNFLSALAQLSGARRLQAERIENSEGAFGLIADELRHQYTLEYYSTDDRHQGGFRAINVQLKRNDLSVRARQGYRLPSPEGAKTGDLEIAPTNQPKSP